MEERGIFKDNEAPQSLNVVQKSVPLIGPAEELPATPASAAAATPDSTEGHRMDRPGPGIFKDNEAPQSLEVVQNSVPLIGPTEELLMPSPANAASATPDSTEGKKKRYRAGQYESDSKAMLSSMSILLGTPLTEDFPASKRGRGLYNFKDDGISSSRGSHLTHRNFTVNSGEDIAKKICFLALQFRAICIISGHGTISSFTLRSPGGTSKYEGIFELLSLTGYFLPSNAAIYRRSGVVAVSLAFRDGRTIGGQLAGPLVAAGPVQVVVYSFRPNMPRKPREQKKDKGEQKKGKEIADHTKEEQKKGSRN
ncbi:hypothetical protein TSUD_294020 [Trifolium subterraneum]|uniref:AT-hook motif nuclear-localized protein n=1 Tax=Trifolium subterraneum TaxID=3900 RepID=A0A2Z6NAY4_TRISU|nr:hypothetical protein TSUD_294020 [Trifolium subterraneum]